MSFLDLSDGSDKIHTSTIEVRSHAIFIDDEIGDPSEYRDVIHTLYTCEPNDDVTIVINSTGGRVDTALAIIEAMQGCRGDVTAAVIGAAYSAASMIACAAPECYITDSAEFMLHTAHYGSVGTVPNVKNQTEFVTRQVNRVLEKLYKGFLTDKEIEALRTGTEFWFDSTEAAKRMQRRSKHMAKGMKNGNATEEGSSATAAGATKQGRGKRSKAQPIAEDQAGRHDNNSAKDRKAE